MKKAFARILLIFFSLGMAMFAGELGLRIINFRQPAILPASVREQYKKDPGATFVYRGYLPGTFEDFENTVKLNQWGFHDEEFAPDRPTPDTYRVMVLGDSYVASLSTPLEDVFHKRIQRRLQADDPLKRGGYQVIAFGQGRKSQVTELEWLRKYGPIYHPDTVLLVFFCGNDVMENSTNIFAHARGFGERYMTEVLPRKEAFFNRLMLFPRSRMNGAIAEGLTSLYSEHIYRFIPGIKPEDLISPELGVYQTPLAPEWVDAFSRTDELLREIRDECAKQGSTLLITFLESPQAVGDVSEHYLWSHTDSIDYNQPARWIAGWCATNHVPVCDLESTLVAAGRRKVFWRHDGHLNVYGNQVIADPLYHFIIDHAARPEG